MFLLVDGVNLMQKKHNELLLKYNRPGPRYTSYPPVPFWKGAPDEAMWIGHLKTIYSDKEGMDLYVHVPFCEKLCYYCGCNRIITKNHDNEEKYVDLILKEWGMYKTQLGFTPVINSLHFGGGTPTFLSAENLERLIQGLTEKRSPSFIGSIEIDPRTTKLEHLDCFKKNGIGRVSLGIQDFDDNVQAAINRKQSFELVENLVNELRARGIDSINFDVIYGLPRQTVETITGTFELIRKLKPDLIAYYSYAHLPEKLKNQRLIKTEELPDAQMKHALYEKGKELLAIDGYEDVGMDHFALPNNFLYQAKVENRLHRNFMGYVDKKSKILLGLGPSSISDSSLSFMQNEKGFNEYERKIQAGKLAVMNGHVHEIDDLGAQEIILNLMCKDEGEIKGNTPYLDEILRELEEFQRDGLLIIKDNKIKVLPEGKKFIRNVAMTFDFYFREKMPKDKFSQTI